MRLLVTGVTGFIGGAVARRALADGHSVAGLVRPQSRDWTPPPGLLVVPGTLDAPPPEALQAFRPDTILHAAWIATPGTYLESPDNDAHLDWSLAFLSRWKDASVRRIVALGTCLEYAPGAGARDEFRSPLAPVSAYARAKHRLHQELQALVSSHPGHPALVWARIFHPYGPGEHPGRLASQLLSTLRRNQPFILHTPHAIRDYIHIDDLAAALLHLLAHPADGPFNVGSGVGIPIGTFARTLAGELGRPDLVRFAPQAPADPTDRLVADISRLRTLGWQPRVSIGEGLRHFVRHPSQ